MKLNIKHAGVNKCVFGMKLIVVEFVFIWLMSVSTGFTPWAPQNESRSQSFDKLYSQKNVDFLPMNELWMSRLQVNDRLQLNAPLTWMGQTQAFWEVIKYLDGS